MKFNNILQDIERLVGLELKAINPKTANLTVTEVDHKAQKFFFKLSSNGRIQSRPFAHLETIWNELLVNSVANVEAVLEGANSSRHVPETIIANLPYVEHFKYDRKKHLYLSGDETHRLGELKEAKPSDVKKLKSALDNLKSFDRIEFSNEFEKTLAGFDAALKEARVKFPGEFNTSKLSFIENSFNELLNKLKGTYVEPAFLESRPSDHISTLDSLEDTIELDAPEIIGYEGGTLPEIEGNEDYSDELDDNNQLSTARIRFNPTTVSLIYDRLLHKEIELQPDFQRKGRIWSAHNKSALIESILIGLPIPTFYFAERLNGSWVIVDGLQRTTTLFDFISNQFSLKELKFLKDLNDKCFDELPRPYQRKIREYQLHCHIISIKKDSDTMVRELFQRINTYGVKMSYQEIRCALYPGSSVKFLRYIAESKQFQVATFGKIQPKRMKDMELVLGAIAHILFGYKDFSETKFDSFLTKAMQALNKKKHIVAHWPDPGTILLSPNSEIDSWPTYNESKSDPLFNELLSRFNSALELAIDIFGTSRFKKEVGGTVVSKPLFELIVSVFALLEPKYIGKLKDSKKEFKTKFYKLVNGSIDSYVDWESEHYKELERGFEYSISQSTGKRVTIIYRFDNFISLLSDLLGEKLKIQGILEKNDQ
ncbi:DUF262 domain-containing protein [Pseudoalteromonas mariniglutinosa]|uniref:DUF262 domain-containing protein n=1 Tax=Pseudoalteromonas mariniglutinosa TaxID=206042 RepID=UPI00384C89F4